MSEITVKVVAILKADDASWVPCEAIYTAVGRVHYIDALVALNVLYYAGVIRKRGFGETAEYLWV